jgi:hypothetical protein
LTLDRYKARHPIFSLENRRCCPDISDSCVYADENLIDVPARDL